MHPSYDYCAIVIPPTLGAPGGPQDELYYIRVRCSFGCCQQRCGEWVWHCAAGSGTADCPAQTLTRTYVAVGHSLHRFHIC